MIEWQTNATEKKKRENERKKKNRNVETNKVFFIFLR